MAENDCKCECGGGGLVPVFMPLGKICGGGSGGSGGSGVTFTPSVSEDGVLSWSNDGGLPNPAPVSIMGPQGPSGGPNYVGKIDFTFYDPADVAANLPGWIFMGGGLYPLDSAEGRALNSLPDKFKQNAGIVSDGVNINAPKMFYSDGRGYFVRAADGVSNAIGSVRTDKIRNITGTYGAGRPRSITGGATAPTGPFYGSQNGAATAATGTSSHWVGTGFDASLVVPTGAENEPININLTPIMYLGV